MRPVKKGDMFLLPYKGVRIERLIRAIRKAPGLDPRQWWCEWGRGGGDSVVLLSSCERCSPSEARRILKSYARACRK